MSEHLHHKEPALSNEFGWSRMQVLLDEHMPVHVTQTPRRQLWQILAAAMLAGILICAGLHTGDSLLIEGVEKPVVQSGTSAANVSPAPNIIAGTMELAVTIPAKIATHNEELQVPASEEETLLPTFNEQETEHSKVSFILPGKIAAMKAEAARISFPARLHGLTITNDLPGTRRGGRWDLAIGLGQHFSMCGSNELAPFPAAEISYHVSRQVSLRVGLDLFAPVHSNVTTLNKTVYVNDPLNNIQLINETATYHQLNYINVPLALSLAISKNLFVETGFQASFLVSNKKSMSIEAYDYQMNRLPAPSNGPPLIAAASPPPQVAATPANVDHRLLGGVRYTMGKTSLNLNYQQALNSVLPGKTPGNSRNQLLTLKVLYKLK